MSVTLSPELAALRFGVAFAELDHVARLRISGRGAFAALDAVLARGVPLREARAVPALLLRDDGSVLADVLVVGEAGGALVLAEGASAATIAAHLRAHAPADAEIDELDASHALMTLEGPFAWELLGALVGPDVLAAPYHTSFALDLGPSRAIRAGKAGEYAYHLLIPRDHEAALRAQLAELAPRFGLQTIGRAARALGALEQGSFDVDHGCAAELTPLELQLQWRVDYNRRAPGIAAVRAQRDRGGAGRVTWWVAPADQSPECGATVALAGRQVGRVIHAAASPALGGLVGLALLDCTVAHPGLAMTWADRTGQFHPLQTVAPPLLNNRSLFVHPYRHTYARRDEITSPPLSRLAPNP